MKNWKQKPEKEEVEQAIKDFFTLLNKGKLNKAKNFKPN